MSVKRVVTYDEIADKQEIFLSGLSFSHAPLPESIEEARRLDPRLPKEFAFFALDEQEELLGRAGVVLTVADTRKGELRIGGIWGVRTSPWRTQRGVATTLVDHVHDYLNSRDVDVFSLGIVRYSVARQIYNKMGYFEIDEGIRTTAAKWAEKSKGRLLSEKKYCPDDAGQVQEISERSNEGLYGFTCREQDFISKRHFLGGYDPEDVSVYKKGDEIVGYAAFRSKGPLVTIGEIRAIDAMTYGAILAAVEDASTGLPILISNGFSAREEQWLVDAGYVVRKGDYSARMMRGIGRLSAKELNHLLGVKEGQFRQQTLFDLF